MVGFQLPEDGDWAVTQSLPSFQWLSRVRLHQAASGVLQARGPGPATWELALGRGLLLPAPANLEREVTSAVIQQLPSRIHTPTTIQSSVDFSVDETTPYRPARPERRVLFVDLATEVWRRSGDRRQVHLGSLSRFLVTPRNHECPQTPEVGRPCEDAVRAQAQI